MDPANRHSPHKRSYSFRCSLLFFLFAIPVRADTVALWLFDEQAGLYPSCVMGDAASGDLRLDAKDGLFSKRTETVIVVPHHPDESELWRRIVADFDERMPPPDSGKRGGSRV